jgi:hypothetical protein
MGDAMIICGYFAVNNKHRWVNGHCLVCQKQEE